MKVAEYFRKIKRKRIIKFLTSTSPQKIEKIGEKLLIPAFRRAAKKVPAYSKILKERGINYEEVKNVESFKRLVPVIDKKDTFQRFEIEELCVGGTLKEMKLAMSSSGFSGVYAFGINTYKNYKMIAQSIDTALDYTFNISEKETFLVNCIPMGVKVHTSLKLAETSVRSDMALAIIKKFSPKFEQTLIVSDPHFLKKLIEEGNEMKINWKKLKVSLIFGEDWFSESFRDYMAELINLDLNNPQGRLIGATMGIAELDLNLFHESWHTILMRKKIQENEDLRRELFKDAKVAPIIFHYYPHRIFLEALPEESEEKELVFSMLSPYMLIPLMRYNSKDKGKIFSYMRIKDTLSKYKLSHLLPELKLPLVAVEGRRNRFVEKDGKRLYPEEVKQGLYEDFEVASTTTGYFRLSKENNSPKLEIQLKKGIRATHTLKEKFKKALLKYSEIDIPVILYHYQDFPYAMELDYEKKFRHL